MFDYWVRSHFLTRKKSMFDKPTKEHQFFDDMIGEWTFEHSCDTTAEQSSSSTTGKAIAKSYGGLWLIMECEGNSEPMGRWFSQFTLGYDPQNRRYHGTFVASMMSHLWLYQGQVDSSGKRLVLDVRGPQMAGDGMANYQDIFEIVDRDYWILRSQIQGDDGNWSQFMEGHHRRVA
jgi:hypothetical protein